MKRIGPALGVTVILTAALATALAVWPDQDPARANPSLMVGLDMNPAGNFCGGPSTDCTLGPIDQCISVPNQEGYEFSIDLWVSGLDNGFLQFNENLQYPDSQLIVQAEDVSNAGWILTAQSEGSVPVEFGEDTPDPPGSTEPGSPYHAAVSESGTFETSPPFTQGVVDRLTLRVAPGATAGVYPLSLDGPPLAAYLDKDGSTYEVEVIGGGLVAIGEACPLATATPTPTSTATPAVSPTPTPTTTATPPAGTQPLVLGWNDSCYQGLSQPIGDALASVMTGVQAVYRMRGDQTFDRWFSGRSDLSTISTLDPFDQLFILMSDNATWTAQPVAPLATSAALHFGWNSVCYLGGGKDTTAAAAGIAGAFSIVYNLPPDQVWRRYVPGQSEVSNLTRLETFTSVLILMTDPAGGTWTFSP